MSGKSRYRCAIYTRKSTDDGLEQDFNSLDAQRESCEAYITSQRSEGWRVIKTRYDDGGISGATMERPALQCLLQDVRSGKVDIIVVYKIDRLTRSLMDFAKMVEVFDAHDASFVSVTQAFNTTTSMGRLTLNVLLSFAQFEREVTAERIRDKIAASKKKGMWMGGPVPLGYDARDKQLIVNEVEARTVRRLFELYLEIKSVRRMKERADALGIVTKRRIFRNGRKQGGKPFSRGNLYLLLSNSLYIGKIPHHGQIYAGRHKRIIDQNLWDAVQDMMAANAVHRASSTNVASPSILTGLVFDETGDRLSPSQASKNGVRYRYYISHRLMEAQRNGDDGWRLPANEIENLVITILCRRLTDKFCLTKLLDLDDASPHTHQIIFSAADQVSRELNTASAHERKKLLHVILNRIELHSDTLMIEVNVTQLESLLKQQAPDTTNTNEPHRLHSIEISHQLKRRGVGVKLIIGGNRTSEPNHDPYLVATIAKAHHWLHQLTSGNVSSIEELANIENEDRNELSRNLPLAFLAPDITRAILSGTQPASLTASRLKRVRDLPLDWSAQARMLGFKTA